jgi:inhibitor of KinA sporulation pathway (predicted exonuclease)
MPYDYLAVLDFEATCWERPPLDKEHEIIEFPTVIVDVRTCQVIDKFEQFVRPTFKPKVSEFCHKLTTITQAQVDGGVTIKEALVAHQKFMAKYPNSIFVTCGDWDLKTMLLRDTARNRIKTPSIYSRWINIKHVFLAAYPGKKAPGMLGMLEVCGLKLKGTHHRGIDDCQNIAQIAIHLLKFGAFGSDVATLKIDTEPKKELPAATSGTLQPKPLVADDCEQAPVKRSPLLEALARTRPRARAVLL